MWLMPSYGRPEAPAKLRQAPGGLPDWVGVCVLVNADDPALERYRELVPAAWRLHVVPAGSRFADAVRDYFQAHPDEPFYGIIDDDYWPVSPGWHDQMVEAAGPNAIAIANNQVNFPSLYTCRVMGGDLARAIGTIAPGKMRHNFSDDTWARFAEDFGLLRPLADVIVEHHHHLFDASVKKDATYERGSHDFQTDQALYRDWLNSDERREQCDRVAALLGLKITATDLSKVKLAICVPIQDTEVDISFHLSLINTMALLANKGIRVRLFESCGGSHIGKARERVLWLAMHNEEPFTHIAMIDADMGWEPELIVRFICADHDFAAAVGRKKIEETKFCFNPIDPPQLHPITGFAAAHHTGFAFVVLKRSVIERLCQFYPELEYDTGNEPREWALFYDMIWKSGRTTLAERLSEDYSFCQRWRNIGGEIYVDLDAELIHAGRKEYKGKPRDMLKPEGALDAAAA